LGGLLRLVARARRLCVRLMRLSSVVRRLFLAVTRLFPCLLRRQGRRKPLHRGAEPSLIYPKRLLGREKSFRRRKKGLQGVV